MASIFVFLLVLAEALAVVLAFRAMTWSRTPQGAVAWVVFLISAPYIAIVSYLFLGHSRIRGYVVARREYEEIVTGVEAARVTFPPRCDGRTEGLAALETIAASPVLSGNGFDLLVDGDETFDAMFAAIDAAHSYVLLQSYIIRDDQIGRDLKTRLIAARNRGVQVYVLYDSIGCSRLPNSYVKELSDIGVRIYDSNALRGPTKRFQLNFRNHRKTLVVDGMTGFTGGLNIGDEYLGRDPKVGPWRDTHCLLRGPIVLQLQLAFCEDWHWATQEYLYDQIDWPREAAPESRDALLLTSGPADEMETGNLFFNTTISTARRRIWIASPYFVPDPDIITALKVAALKGLDVRILLPANADHWVTWLAAFAYFDELRTAGVQFWFYEPGFMHQKVVLIDNSLASVGTMNLDSRSCRLNFEAVAIFLDSAVAEDIQIMFKEDFARAYPLEKTIMEQPVFIRLLAPFARLFAPLL